MEKTGNTCMAKPTGWAMARVIALRKTPDVVQRGHTTIVPFNSGTVPAP
jgi:hypothetical protein